METEGKENRHSSVPQTDLRSTGRMRNPLDPSTALVALAIFLALGAIAPAQNQAQRPPTPAPLTVICMLKPSSKGLSIPGV